MDLAPPHSVAHSVFVMYIRSLLCCFFPIFLLQIDFDLGLLLVGFLGFIPAIAFLLETVRVANCGGESPRRNYCYFEQSPVGCFFYPISRVDELGLAQHFLLVDE